MREPLGTAPLMIGRYAIFEEVARGGMAAVHVGRLCGPGGFTRTVAVKRLHPAYASDPEFVAMFLDEARLAARISHPNVVPTLDVVATGGELFMVMDYVHGESFLNLLGAAQATGALAPIDVVCQIVHDALLGLHAAHEACSPEGQPLAIVHRDVSPQNVLVGVDGIAKVIDFGVAKAVQRMRETRDGNVKGKVSYMSPEQLSGQPVDRRTDIWAASVVLWEALAGRRLFDFPELGTIVASVLGGKLAPPSQYNPGVSPELDAVVMRGLAVSVEARYQTGHDMATALEEVMVLAPTRTVGVWVLKTAREPLEARDEIISRTEHSEVPELPATSYPPAALGKPKTYPTTTRARSRLGWALALAVGVVGALVLVKPGDHLKTTAPPIDSVASAATDSVSTPIVSVTTATAITAVNVTTPPAPAPKPRHAATAKAHETAPVPSPPPVTAEPPHPSPPPRQNLANARVEVGAATNVGGTTAAKVNRVIQPLAGRMTECYRGALPKMTGALEGPGVLRIETDEEGVIVHASLSGAVAAPCVTATLTGRKIADVDTGRAHADVPLAFHAQ